jgi:kynurenine formamidase
MPLTDELRALAQRVSNWGRWGPDDQRGTLNLITPEATRRGAAAVRSGVAYSLAIPLDQSGPQWEGNGMPDRVNPELKTHTVNVAFTGDPADFTTTDDSFRMGSQAATHLDALSHVGYEGKLWNDTPNTVVSAAGAAKLGIEHDGAIATRGLLLDMARLKGVEYFEENYAITGDDLDAAATRGGITVESGDAVLVRTGHMHFLRQGDRIKYSFPAPGLSTKSIEWMRDHDIALVATDTITFEVYPCEDPNVFMPVHMIQLRDMGLAQGQNFSLDELAAACAADGRIDCLLVATPLPLTGAAGAPVAPTAIR